MQPYNKVLSLARAGNPVRAWEKFRALGLGEATSDIKALTLKGRLLKDLGDRAAGDERLRLYREASQAYLAANELRTDSYPLINAATLALLSQDGERAGALARQALDLIGSNPEEGETPYWREATRAEALVLLGEPGKGEAALADGIAKLPRAWEDHAATIGQFERIIAAQGGDAAWLDAHRPAPAVHFSGLIGLDPDGPGLVQAIDQMIARLSPGFAFGALAAGADIILAEKLVEAGVLLHIVLPFERETFCAASVEPFGEQWRARFDALIERAETVSELWDGAEAQEYLAPLVEAANMAAMGHTLRRAETLRSHAHALAIKAIGEPLRAHLHTWEASGGALHLIEAKRASNGSGNGGAASHGASLTALLAVRGGDPARLLASQELDVLLGTDTIEFAGPMSQCLALASELHTWSPEAAAGIIVCPVESDDARSSAAALASRLALTAGAGQLFSDPNAAMIAKVLEPAKRVEELGEVGTLSGPLTVYAIA